jgi:hypothetical protein
MLQTWHSLLFMHWPVRAAALAPFVPDSLEIETFDGTAWVAVVPFGMRRVRLRGFPEIPGTSAFLELNVRTYVRPRRAEGQAKPGVWFFSLDAENRLAVEVARRWFHLPYFHARMSLESREDTYSYRSTRVHRGSPAAEFACRYGPDGPVTPSVPGSLEHWLTERYCLYCTDSRGRLQRGEIHHAPWPLQRATADLEVNSMASASSIPLPGTPPLMHFARELDVRIWSIEPVLPFPAHPNAS